MSKEFPNPNGEQKSVMRDGFFGLGHWALFGHLSLGFSHYP